MLAAANQAMAALHVLLEEGADTEVADPDGFTPLLYIASEFNADVLKTLLDAGANPDAVTTPGGNSALQRAAHAGWAEGVEILLDHGADPDIVNVNGFGPRDMAAQQGHQDIVAILDAYSIGSGDAKLQKEKFVR